MNDLPSTTQFTFYDEKDTAYDPRRSHSYTFMVEGVPVAWARAGRQGGRYYDKQTKEKREFANALYAKHPHLFYGRPYPEYPLDLSMTFFMPIPDSYSKKKCNLVRGKPHIFTPDLSNLIKFVEDAITDILIKDDCMIANITAMKIYDDLPRTVFTLQEAR